ncbi:LacI family DNA-binding transcriptional regulator [Microbacterium hibisci]|uniref:LacI family DNA-binding transcriptional regulator n=1 Tax=Microbacterium hibisci TaxID=2036000 RepID=UPI001EF25A5F|nr:LacI family DNA-binding transcriptional regulator [Microbacterium hibisci]
MPRANRTDVARLAGVSTAVVSYVLNDGPRPVADATRQRVLAAVEQLGYRPNASARALKLSRTDVLGLMVDDITNPFFSEIAAHVQRFAHQHGYGVMIGGEHREGVEQTTELQNMVAREVDGIAIFGARRQETLTSIARAGIKVVSMDWNLTAAEIPSVGIDDYGATRQGIDHLLWHGHEEVAFIAGTHDVSLRRRAWIDAMTPRCSPERLEQLQAAGDFTREGGYAAAKQLLERPDRPTAVFVSSDVQAFGALRAVQQSGLRVPQDIAMVSLDGTNASAFTCPSLTAIQLPLETIARCSVEKLISESSGDLHLTVPHALVIRESCGCQPAS